MVGVTLPAGNRERFHDGHDTAAMDDESGTFTGGKLLQVVQKSLTDTVSKHVNVVTAGDGIAAHAPEPGLIKVGTVRVFAEFVCCFPLKQAEIRFCQCTIKDRDPAGE